MVFKIFLPENMFYWLVLRIPMMNNFPLPNIFNDQSNC